MKKKFRKVVAVISATVMVLAMGVVSVNASDIQPRQCFVRIVVRQ